MVVRGDFGGEPAVSTPIEYDVELSGDTSATAQQLRELAARVDEIAEIPNSLRRGTAVTLAAVHTPDVA